MLVGGLVFGKKVCLREINSDDLVPLSDFIGALQKSAPGWYFFWFESSNHVSTIEWCHVL
jgi:hypothetical protein